VNPRRAHWCCARGHVPQGILQNHVGASRQTCNNRLKLHTQTVKNAVKDSASSASSVSDAAVRLGVSIPTIKRMVREHTLEGFHTPGGHLRVTAENIEAVKGRQALPRPVMSSVLQDRRERLEELTLQAQEYRAKRELERLRIEEQRETAEREAEAQAREQEAAERREELRLERRRLELERAKEARRRERQSTEEREARKAERELAAFRTRWLDHVAKAVTARQYAWLIVAQQKEILQELETEIGRRQPGDEPRMAAIINRSLEALVYPHRAAHDAQQGRLRCAERALRSLPWGATEPEKLRGAAAVREALGRISPGPDPETFECEIRLAAEAAIEPIRQKVERRSLCDRMLAWAVRQLPQTGNDRDAAGLRRECTDILAELPANASEREVREALQPPIQEAREQIRERQSAKDRQARIESLIDQGLSEVSIYLLQLRQEGQIDDEDFFDPQFTADVKKAVRQDLEAELTGSESAKEVRNLARDLIDELE
jgi:excisionase family DNA binding protein